MDVREELCYSDAYARTVEARVANVDDSGDAPLVVLDRTVFYPGGGRMDFEFETMSGDLVDAIEATVNAELAHKRDVRVNVLPRAAAFAIPDLIRTKINLLPPGIEEIRTIEIVGLDLQADGGTHVANTREVGPIRVTGYESKGRINKRIRILLEA